MDKKNFSESRDRPFPWVCANCLTRTVVPTVIEHTAKIKHDGVIYELHLPNVEIPRCQTCGEIYPTAAVDDKVSDVLRERLRLLAPVQIREAIKQLGLKQKQLAERIGVEPETISRLVNGARIQSRALDNLLRLYFADPARADRVLSGVDQDPQLETRREAQDCPSGSEDKAVPTPCNRVFGRIRRENYVTVVSSSYVDFSRN